MFKSLAIVGLLNMTAQAASINNQQTFNTNTYDCDVDSSYNCYDKSGVSISYQDASTTPSQCYKEGGDTTQAAINCGPSQDGDTIQGASRLTMLSMGTAAIALLNM